MIDCVLLQDPQSDLLDLVADRGRPLELELLGRRAHLSFHLDDELLDPRAVELAQVTTPLVRVDDGPLGHLRAAGR